MEKFMGNLDQFWAHSHAWIVGCVLIGLSSYTRFNIPLTSRSSTTWGRYHTAAFTYMAVTLTGWIVLANTPDLLDYLVRQGNLDTQAKQLTAPLYAALVLTVLVSSLKPLRKVDEKLRTFFHDLARIPWEAKRLSAALRARTWLPTPHLQAEVTTALRDAGFSESDISFADDRSPQALWTKVSALHYHHMNRWQSGEQRRFAAFYYQHLSDFQKLSQDYNALAVMARRVFHLLATLQPIQDDPRLAEVQEELIDGFIVGAERLEKNFCDLASRALLQCALTEKTRREELEAMGFVVNVAPDPVFDRILLLYITLGGLYIAVLSIAKRPSPILTGAIIGTIYVGAVLAALYPKRWMWARRNGAGRPIRGYALSGVLGFVCAMVASFSLGVLLTWDIRTTVQQLHDRLWPWGLMAAFTAAATAYNIDNDEWPGRRRFEATLQAAIGVVGALIVYLQLKGMCGETLGCAPSPVRVILSAAVSGGLIGWLVPTWCREPQTMTVDYKQWKVMVIAQVLPHGQITPTIRVMRPREQGQRRDADAQAASLPFEEEFPSAEEALAKAVEYARKHIDGDRKAIEPARLSAA